MTDRIASVDIGTNSLRLLVAEIIDGGLKRLHMERRVARLGKGLSNGTKLSQDRMKRCLDILDEYRQLCDGMGANKILPVGTSPFRKARNAGDFVARIKELTDLEVMTLEGEQEGYLCLLGVLKGFGNNVSEALIIDIGGGSTEIIRWTKHEEEKRISSLPLGMVHLTETFLLSDPPVDSEIVLCEKAIAKILDKRLEWTSPEACGDVVIGTAGTLTTLAAMDQGLGIYDPERIHGYRLSREAVGRLLDEIRISPRKELVGRAGLEPGREDVILAGTLIVKALMDRFGKDQFLISDWGLLEGIIINLGISIPP